MVSISSIPILNRFSARKLTIITIVALILLIPLIFLIISLKRINDSSKTNNQNVDLFSQNSNRGNDSDLSSVTFVYGAWEGQTSVIKAVDLITNKTTLLASLPQKIKKISFLSPSDLLYIHATDTRDHGREIVRFNIKEKRPETLLKTDDGFGIDDYLISPNKKYMAVWEVSFAEGSNIFRGGRSRVYAVDLSRPQTKYLLFDEIATEPVHYPQAINNAGKVFTDKFMPNDPNGGAGWAYGMTVISFDGTDRRDLDNMQKGTYGTQPFLSPDGNSLIFAGYDGTKGDGTTTKSGFRRALLTPNTVETLNTYTLKRQKITKFPNSNIYSRADWGGSSDDIVVTILSKSKNQSGTFSYNLKDKSLKKINLPKSAGKSYSYVAQTSDNGLLIGSINDSLSSFGNLGDSYIPSLTNLYFQPKGSVDARLIGLQDVLAQYITLLPANYFENVLGSHTSINDTSFNQQPNLINFALIGENSLQLRTFLLPTQDLIETRIDQQSHPLPVTPTSTPAPTAIYTPTPSPTTVPTPTSAILANQAISPTVVATPTTRFIPTRTPTSTPTPTIPIFSPTPTSTPRFVEDCTELAEIQCTELGIASGTQEFYDCVDVNKAQNRATRGTPEAVCSRSPLYLYGTTDQTVNVKVETNVYNDYPKYNGGYDVKLKPHGSMLIANQLHDAIHYDYHSNLKIMKTPSKGTIARRTEIEKTLRGFAKRLGLNEKETTDLINAGKTKTSSPYIFISFYDQATSEQILPLSFSPKPDNYLNIVFYFKQLDTEPNYSPSPPVFPAPLKRTGYTAVEVSEIVE